MIASNLGDRAAALKSVTLWLDGGGTTPEEVYRLVPRDVAAPPDVALQFEPQKLKFMELRAVNRAGKVCDPAGFRGWRLRLPAAHRTDRVRSKPKIVAQMN